MSRVWKLWKRRKYSGFSKLDVREKIGRFKYVLEENLDEEYKAVLEQLAKEISNITGKEDF